MSTNNALNMINVLLEGGLSIPYLLEAAKLAVGADPEAAKALISAAEQEAYAATQSDPRKPVSQKKLEANRRNALKSTGPRTAEGKAKVRMNALKHGLTSQKLLLRDDEYVEYFERLCEYMADLRPVGAIEEQLALEISEHHVRMNVFSAVQINMLNLDVMDYMNEHPHNPNRNFVEISGQVETLRADCSGPKVFDTIGRQEGRTTRHMIRLQNEFDRRQDRRFKRSKGEDIFKLETCSAYQKMAVQLEHYRKLEAEDRIQQQKEAEEAEQALREAQERAAEAQAKAQAEAAAAGPIPADDQTPPPTPSEPVQAAESEKITDLALFRQNAYAKVAADKKAAEKAALRNNNRSKKGAKSRK